ncbi:hypothetical protein LW347_13885 [Pectobacterium polonicum]|uniref:Uncharacterized protein n=1 Tax=Pectobacterium polonicum TaxID=2485124 RepID=A0AAE9T037_9GAMM|nr:hypothetical protein [Pectobacterium polonicum]MDC9818543.1 hypothetical protein [Pectobacterium polonicum]UVO06997.1 hypothetical protein LW347_13885 [Pectobacterium polonicum]GKW23704.1 hypothetical protein PEC311524_12980 [Pectobacterium carotovorum subsp. carotovorum]
MMNKWMRFTLGASITVLFIGMLPATHAATWQEMQRLTDAYPPGSVVVCLSDLPGDGKKVLPTTLMVKGTVAARRDNLTDYDAVVTWLIKGKIGNELTLTYRTTERIEKTGQYTRIDPDSMAVSLPEAGPEAEKTILAEFQNLTSREERFTPFTDIEITDFPSYISRGQDQPIAHCHKE